jgi:hypothetical protein
MLTALVYLLVYLIAICLVAALALWAVRRFMPEVYPPARLVVGALALIAILLLLLRVFTGGAMPVPQP